MLAYIFKRFLLIIPTVLFVLILSFLLKSKAPGDEAVKLLDNQGVTQALSQEGYQKAYKRITQKFGLDLPSFYFVILPNYFPDNINHIQPKSKRRLYVNILRQTKSLEAVNSFHSNLDNSISKLVGEDDFRILYNELLKLEQESSLSSVRTRSQRISKIIVDSDFQLSAVDSLITSINDLKEKNSFIYPTIRWVGANCQFHFWLKKLFSNTENISLKDGQGSVSKISNAMKWTIAISAISLLLIAGFALLIGFIQALYHESLLDRISSTVLYFFYAIPLFWFATIMVVFFTTPEYGIWTDIFPSIGLKPSYGDEGFIAQLLKNSGQLILPIFCLTVSSLPYLVIQLKSDILESMTRPFCVMARAKGMSQSQVLRNHALPNALIPYLTILSGAIPAIFTGSVIIEVIFNIPGIGRLLFDSIGFSDWPVVFSILVIISVTTILGYIVGDLLLVRFYPKSKDAIIGKSNVQHG